MKHPWLGIAKHLALGCMQVFIWPGESFPNILAYLPYVTKLALLVACCSLLYPYGTLLSALPILQCSLS